MTISGLLNASVNSALFQGSRPAENNGATIAGAGARDSAAIDTVDLSKRGQNLLDRFQQQADETPSPSQLIPVDQRPSAQQSADIILDFIGGRLQTLAANGADSGDIENAYNQAVKGFQRGLTEAKSILQGMQMLTGDVTAGVDRTEQLVNDGLTRLREQFSISNPAAATRNESVQSAISEPPARPAPLTATKVVQAYRQQSTQVNGYSESSNVGNSNPASAGLRANAAAYAESYRRNDSVELSLRTQDGDIISLSFSSAASLERNASLASNQQGTTTTAMLAYQRSASFSSNFSMSVRGDLDNGELDALNSLLEDVSALSDEFFNGDFDRAFTMAMDFQMDSSEFSAMALDLARATRASVTTSYTTDINQQIGAAGRQIGEAAVAAAPMEITLLIEQLLAMVDKIERFDHPQQLFSDLLANQLAQKSIQRPL